MQDLIGERITQIITEKLNDQKHGYIRLAVSFGKVKKITWEAGEVFEDDKIQSATHNKLTNGTSV